MPVQISGNQTTAAVSSVRLRVSVSSVVPNVAVSAVLPAADVAYILLTASANLDTTGRFRYIPEIVVISDAVALAVTKALSSPAVSASDDILLDVAKGLADSVSLTETFLATLVFLREFADSAAVADATALSVDKPLADGVVVQESVAQVITKVLASGVAMNDSFEASDGLLYSFAKGISNVVFAADAATLSHSKGVSDMIAAADAGSLISQGYCDLTYFAEDYVGEARTFT